MKSNRGMAALAGMLIFALVMFAGVFYGAPERAEAAPSGAPTPVTIYSGAGAPQVANFLNARRVITSNVIYSSIQNLQNSEKIDLQWVVAQSTPNALSIQLQYSNDGVNWIGGPYAIATPNATPQNDMQQFPVFGRYGRIAVDTAITAPVTVTVLGLGK